MASNQTNYKLLLRGALGGTLGAPLVLIGAALNDKFRLGHIRYNGALEILALPYFLPIGAALGAIIGGIIWIVAAKVKANPPAILRAIIGPCLLVFLYFIQLLVGGEDNRGLIPPTRVETAINAFLILLFFGILPGIMARPATKGAADR
jgi:hypothetical protein